MLRHPVICAVAMPPVNGLLLVGLALSGLCAGAACATRQGAAIPETSKRTVDQSMAPHAYVGMWVTDDPYIRRAAGAAKSSHACCSHHGAAGRGAAAVHRG